MVKYLEHGNYALKPAEGELVGNWTRSPVDGLIHVFLETPLQALADKAVQGFAKYAEMHRMAIPAPKSTKARTPRTPKPEPGPSEDEVKISELRKIFGK